MEIDYLKNKLVYKLFINDDKDLFCFMVLNPEKETRYSLITYEVYAECCSESWIEDIEGYENLKEQVVLESTCLEVIDTEGIKNDVIDGHSVRSGNEYLIKYGIDIQTIKGICSIEFRNASNGYYGADITKQNNEVFCDDNHHIEQIAKVLGFKEVK